MSVELTRSHNKMTHYEIQIMKAAKRHAIAFTSLTTIATIYIGAILPSFIFLTAFAGVYFGMLPETILPSWSPVLPLLGIIGAVTSCYGIVLYNYFLLKEKLRNN